MTTGTSAGRSCDEVLSWAGDVIDPALRAALGTLPPAVRLVADFHFGWCDRDGNPTSGHHGRSICPALALLVAQALGAESDAGLPAAVAVELVHNHTLMHEDVIDGDALCRNRAAACSVFGLGPAILAGDALLALAFDALATRGGPRSSEGVQLLSRTAQKLLEYRLADVGTAVPDDTRLEAATPMAGAGALMGCACALGELFATGQRASDAEDHLRLFGEQLGLAADGDPSIWGGQAVTARPAGTGPAGPSKSPTNAAARARAGAEGARALEHLNAAPLHGRAASELHALASLVASRDR